MTDHPAAAPRPAGPTPEGPHDDGSLDYLFDLAESQADMALRDPSPDSDGVYEGIRRAISSARLYVTALRTALASARAALDAKTALLADAIRQKLEANKEIANVTRTANALSTELQQAQAALSEATRREGELRGIANEMLSDICTGRLASIGAIDNTFLPQISTNRVKRWQSALAARAALPEETR